MISEAYFRSLNATRDLLLETIVSFRVCVLLNRLQTFKLVVGDLTADVDISTVAVVILPAAAAMLPISAAMMTDCVSLM